MQADVRQTRIDLRNGDEAARLESLVGSRFVGRLWEFHVLLARDGLILRGNCQTYHVKQLAQHTVMEATGASIAANEIKVSKIPWR